MSWTAIEWVVLFGLLVGLIQIAEYLGKRDTREATDFYKSLFSKLFVKEKRKDQ